MSHYDYDCSKRIAAKDYPFYAIIMTAMRQADDRNLEMLRGCWPEVYGELLMRYNAPGGFLDNERNNNEMGKTAIPKMQGNSSGRTG